MGKTEKEKQRKEKREEKDTGEKKGRKEGKAEVEKTEQRKEGGKKRGRMGGKDGQMEEWDPRDVSFITPPCSLHSFSLSFSYPAGLFSLLLLLLPYTKYFSSPLPLI